jgi:hypothetical protein
VKFIILMALVIAVFVVEAHAKRLAPPEVLPISRNGITYSTSLEELNSECIAKKTDCGMRVFLIAMSKTKLEPMWKTEVYNKVYEPGLETDIQDNLPLSLKFKGKTQLELVNEQQASFVVDLKTGSIIEKNSAPAPSESPAKMPLPASATEKIFEILAKTENPAVILKAPMSVEAENIICNHGTGNPDVYSCSAEFKVNGRNLKKDINSSTLLFNYLNGKNAIAVDEVMIGGVRYKSKKLACAYKLDSEPYYKCTSELSVQF